MLKAERYQAIVDYVNENGAASVEELAKLTQVSMATVRRDLIQLAQNKVLLRTHGGAVTYRQDAAEELPIEVRSQMNRESKDQVAEAAVSLIHEDTTIYIGAGSTGRALAAKLGAFHRLTVLTNDLDVAREVAATDNTLIVAGGQLKKGSWTLYGYFTEQMLQELQVDQAFMIVDAIDLNSGFMDYSVDEVTLKRLVIHNAKHCYMLCNAEKFDITAFVNVCALDAVEGVVTNAELEPSVLNALRDTGLQVIETNPNK